MYLFKFKTIDKYQNFKHIHLRFYLLLVCYALGEFYELFVEKNALLKNLFALIVSQLFFQLV